MSVDNLQVNAPLLSDGTEPIDDQWIRSGLLRLTAQVTPRNKVRPKPGPSWFAEQRQFFWNRETRGNRP